MDGGEKLRRELSPLERVVLDKLKAAGIERKELVEALGIADSTAHLILDGKRGVPIWHIEKIAALLEMTVSQLFSTGEADQYDDEVKTAYTSGIPSTGVPANATLVARSAALRPSERALTAPANGTAEILEFLAEIAKRAVEIATVIQSRDLGEQAPAAGDSLSEPHLQRRTAGGSHSQKRR